MKEFILLVVAIAIWAMVWRFAAKHWRRKGWNVVVSHVSAGVSGLVLSVIFLAVILPDEKTQSANTASDASAAQSEKTKLAGFAAATAETAGKLTASKSSAQTETVDDAPSASLDMSPDEYQERFNRILKSVDMPFRAKLRIEVGSENNVARASLNDHLALLGTVDKKTGKLKDIMLIGNGDGTSQSGANIVIVAVATLASATPNGSTKTVGPEVIELMKSFDDESREPASRIFNGVKFSHMRSKVTGALFSAEPA